MARSFLTAINLNKNELQNAAVQNLGAAPSSPVKGQLYFNSTGGDNTLYWWDGTSWVPAKASGGAFPGYGTITASTTFGQAKSDGAATTVARSDHVHGTPSHGAADHTTIPISTFAAATGVINMANWKINSVGPPLAAGDAVNLATLQSYTSGLSWKNAVKAATTANVTMSGGQTLDGIVCSPGDRVLVKNQTTASQNGLYDVTAGAWTRTTDADVDTEIAGAAVFVMQGTVNADTSWVVSTDLPITVGTTNITWVQFSGSGTVTGGAGLTQTGNTLNVVAADGSIIVGADDIKVGYQASGGNYGTAVTAARSDHTHLNMTRVAGFSSSAATSTACAHNFNSRNVAVEVFRSTTPWDTVDVDVERTDMNTVTVRFAAAVGLAEYSIAVFG